PLLGDVLILGQLFDLFSAQQIRTAVADVRERRLVAFEPRGRNRRAHARDVVVGARAFPHGSIGFRDRFAQHFGSRQSLLAEQARFPLRENFERHRRGNFAGLVSTDAVGDRDEWEVGEERVLVLIADASWVGQRRNSEVHYARASRTDRPTATVSPGRRMTGRVNGRSFTNVPLVEPRSSTYHSPSEW